MKLGGLVGRLVLDGDLEPFVELVRTAEVVHVGKGATFGLGELVVEPAEDSGPAILPKNPYLSSPARRAADL